METWVESEDEYTALSDATFHFYFSAVLLHDGLDDGQPQAVAFYVFRLVGLHAIELVEDERQVGAMPAPVSRISI